LLPWNACPSVRGLYMRGELWDFRDVTCLHWSQFKPWQWQKRFDLLQLTQYWYGYMWRFANYKLSKNDDAFKRLNASTSPWPFK